jgi:small-conductance mechanosensitive channel
VGFAFKDIFENFFAGVLILWRFPFEDGDYIACQDFVGRVEDVTIRNTMLRRPTGELVVVPNAIIFKNPVDILTNRSVRRYTVTVGVAYAEDAGEARKVITEAVRRCETVSKDRDLEIFAAEFGDSSLDFEVTWWAGATPLQSRQSRDEVVLAVKRALDEAGIEIPFPYRTLTFKEPLETVRGDRQGERKQDGGD